jgi:hypothetical protein
MKRTRSSGAAALPGQGLPKPRRGNYLAQAGHRRPRVTASALRKAAFAALSRDFIWPLLGLCREVSVSGALSAPPSPAAKIPFPAGETGVSVRARSGSILSLLGWSGAHALWAVCLNRSACRSRCRRFIPSFNVCRSRRMDVLNAASSLTR